MTNAKNTRRALLTSIMSLILCFTMLLSTTFAWFTDTVTSTGNRIMAGNLDVDLLMYMDGEGYRSIADGTGDIFKEGTSAKNSNETLWEPGKTQIVYLAVENKGSLDLKYQIQLRIDGELRNALEYGILDDAEFGNADIAAASTWEEFKAITNVQTADLPSTLITTAAQNGKLTAGNIDYFALAVHMKETAGNEYQGKDVTIDVAVLATQVGSEEDSFGKTYDDGAEFPTYQFPAKVTQTVEDKIDTNTGALTENVVLTNAASSEGSIPVEATLPANVVLEQGVTSVELTVKPVEIPADVAIADEIQMAVALDIHIEGVSQDNTTVIPVTVEGQFPAGLTNVAVYHRDVQMTQVDNINSLAKDTFYYNSANGDVTIGVCGFSVFSFVYVDPTVDDIVVSTPTNLQALLATGGEITLKEDLSLDSTVTVPAGVTVTLDLNGKTITGNNPKDDGAILVNNGTITIVGGTITNAVLNGDSIISNKGTMLLKNVVIEGAPIDSTGYPAYAVATFGKLIVEEGTTIRSDRGAIRMYDDAKVTINGGNIVVTDALGERVLTAHVIYVGGDNSELIINDGAFSLNYAASGNAGASIICPANSTAAIKVNGGNFDYKGSTGGQSGIFQKYMGYKTSVVVCGGTFNDRTFEKYSVATCEIIANDNGTWTVSPYKVESADKLIEVLEKGNDVLLMNDIKIEPASMSNAYGTTGINVKNGQTINGGGHTLDIKGAGGTWDSGINTTGGLIKNLKVTGSFRGIFINHNSDHSEKVVLENVTIDGTVYTISCDQGKYQGLDATNSTFNGWTSYAATIGNVKFTDCNFGEGNGYAFCRPYAPTEFVGCHFEEGFRIDPCAAVTFVNCTLGDVALTAENLGTLVTSNIANATVN